MSTRHARTNDKAANEKNAKTLKVLLQKPDNKYCADCKKKDARWASWNLGIFVCIRCSGIHRSLGVHISKVKSVDLDTWVSDQVENMARWGNKRANEYWEYNLKDKKPSESNMEMWIRAKYEQKRWAMKGPIPDPSTLGDEEDSITTTTTTTTRTQSPASSNTSSVRQSPAREPQVEKSKPAQSDFGNLAAFLGSPSSSPASLPATTTTNTNNNNNVMKQLLGAEFFSTGSNGNNNSSPVQTNNQGNTQHNDFKSAILSLYGTNSASQHNTMANQMAGLNLGGGSGTIQSNNNGWGSPISATSAPPQNQASQGTQIFSNNNGSQPPKKDAFAGLFKI